MLICSKEEFKSGFEKVAARLGGGYIIAMLTDRLYIQVLEQEALDRDELYEKAMEIRMFNEYEEVKWYRGADRTLLCREKNDREDVLDPLFFWDEWQYLDIDDQRSRPEQGIAYATGGGRYELPLKDYKDAGIKIRNYLEYEEDTMQLYIFDWRIIGFSNEGGK